jgi:hypothetical protein
MLQKANSLARIVGKGVVAGVVGTAAMTVSSTIEAKLRKRQLSTAPARAAEKMLGIKEFESSRDVARFSDLVHWGYGTSWGIARALLRELGFGPKLATPLHFAAIWGGALVTLPSLDVAPPIYLWEGEEVAIDVFHHLVYTATTAATYELLDV